VEAGQARQLVLVSFVVSGGVIVYDIIQAKDLTTDQEFRAVWALSLFFLLLAMLADVLPELAGPFAALVTLAILIGHKAALAKIVGTAKPSTTPPSYPTH
jgi:hypothetical protein